MTKPDPRFNAYRADLAAEYLRGIVEAERFSRGKSMRVTAGIAPLRRHPAPDAPLDTELLMGEEFTVHDRPGEGWAWGQARDDRYVGWVPERCLTPAADVPDATHLVGTRTTLLFPGPDLKLPPDDMLPMGARIGVRETMTLRGTGYAVLHDGRAVPSAHLAPIDEVAEDFVAVAIGFMGVPYLWGGKTGLGIDCSGLVQVSMARAGMPVPRDTDVQEKEIGKPLVKRTEELKRGDLVFWDGHVGIMIDGERLLHANGHHMMTAAEPLPRTLERLSAAGLKVTSIRRPPRLGAS